MPGFQLKGYKELISGGEVKKSPFDTRKYKYIVLENGIRVLLISDVDHKNLPHEKIDDEDHEMSEEEENSEEDEEVGSSKNMAAVTVCVHSGSLMDPMDIPGLSHFLEHMLFMGSEKFPNPSDFGNYISGRGGMYNAYTCGQQTLYFFSIPIEYLETALNRFVQFFISPLLLQETMENERIAVDNEFQAAVLIDELRYMRLLQTLMIPNHPASNFFNGNLISLGQNIEKNGIDLRARVRDHWNSYYSTKLMTAAIYAPISVESIDKATIDHLKSIPPRSPSANIDQTYEWTQVFDKSKFNQCYKVKNIKVSTSVILSWVVPPQIKLYKTKPFHFISFIVGHEGDGSLYSFLKRRNWAYRLAAGCCPCDSLNNSHFAVFSISIELSQLGMENLDNVIQAVNSYLHMFRSAGPQERIFNEMAVQSYLDFIFAHQDKPDKITCTVASTMNILPPDHFLSGQYLLYSFDKEAVAEGLNCLEIDKCNIIIASDKFNFEKPQIEEWFNVAYTSEPLPQKWLEFDNNVKTWSDMFLPAQNIFMPTSIEVISSDMEPTNLPFILQDSANFRLYYMYDSKFKLPKCVVKILLRIEKPVTPKMHTFINFYCFCFVHLYQEKIYEAEMAHLNFDWIKSTNGNLAFEFEGYEDKLDTFIDCVITKFLSFELNETDYDNLKEKSTQKLLNSCLKQRKYAHDLQRQLLCHKAFTNIDLLEHMADFTYADFQEYRKRYFSQKIFMDFLICGCITSMKSQNIALNIVKKFKSLPCDPRDWSKSLLLKLPTCSSLYRTFAKESSDKQVTVQNIYQTSMVPIDVTTALVLLEHLLNPFVFEVLRDEEQLGYEVYSRLLFTSYVPCILICVVSDITKYSPSHLDERIECLLGRFIEFLEKMNNEEFTKKVNGLIRKKSQMEACLEDKVQKLFLEIAEERFMFDRNLVYAQQLKEITKDMVIEMAKHYLVNVQHRKKLSIQIIGRNNQMDNLQELSNNNLVYDRVFDEPRTLTEIFPHTLL